MTNEEFYKKLTALSCSNNTAPQMPALIHRARKEHLCIPVVFKGKAKDADPVVIIAQDKKYIQCATALSFPVIMKVPPLKPGQKIGETKLDGFFEQLIDCGYDGLAFLTPVGFIGIEWEDMEK